MKSRLSYDILLFKENHFEVHYCKNVEGDNETCFSHGCGWFYW